MITIISLISILLFSVYFISLKKHRLLTKVIVATGICSAMAYVLYMIQFIRYPQGGGITLFSMLPIMLLSISYGKQAGVTGGLIFGLFKLLNGSVIVHPLQFVLDYLFAGMALGLACVFGTESKKRIVLGCLFASSLSVIVSTISGAVFFGQYAPVGMNPWLYSIIYNFSSAGVESVLTIILVMILPIGKLVFISEK